MLSHCPSTSNRGRIQDCPLNQLHFSRARAIAIIEPMEMEQTVDNVETKFAPKRASESSGVVTCHHRIDENFSVLKRNHIRWTGFIHELPVQRRYFPIGHDQDRNLRQLLEFGFPFARQAKTQRNGFSRELLKIDNVDRHFALKIPHPDSRSREGGRNASHDQRRA